MRIPHVELENEAFASSRKKMFCPPVSCIVFTLLKWTQANVFNWVKEEGFSSVWKKMKDEPIFSLPKKGRHLAYLTQSSQSHYSVIALPDHVSTSSTHHSERVGHIVCLQARLTPALHSTATTQRSYLIFTMAKLVRSSPHSLCVYFSSRWIYLTFRTRKHQACFCR